MFSGDAGDKEISKTSLERKNNGFLDILLSALLSVRGTEALAASSERHYDQALKVEFPIIPIETTVLDQGEQDIKITECFCVTYIRETFGVPIRGDADTLQSNITFQKIKKSDVVLLKYGAVFHASYLLQVFPGGMWVAERILIQGKCLTRERLIEWKDKAIYGFYREKTTTL